MKPGKRNCERRRQSAWRGQYWWTMSSLFHLCLSRWVRCGSYVCLHPFFSLSVSCQCETTPYSSICLFTPLRCLSHFLHLSVSFPLYSFCLFPLSSLLSHSAAQTPLWHPFSPFIHSSVAADVNRVTVCPLSPSGANLCCHTTDHLLWCCSPSVLVLCLLTCRLGALVSSNLFTFSLFFRIIPQSTNVFFFFTTGRPCLQRWVWQSVKMEAL